MHRKLFILFFVSLTVFLTGCKNDEEKIGQFDFDYPTSITVQKNFTEDCIENENNYREVTIENEEQIKRIIDNINAIQYVELDYEILLCGFDYKIEFDDEHIFVTGDILNSRYTIKNGNFNFLDSLNYSVITE